jgi:hypothetical protein
VESTIFPALARRDVERIGIVRAMAPSSEVFRSHVVLCDVLELECADRYREAAEVGGDGYDYPTLQAQIAFCWLVDQEPDRAESILQLSAIPSNPASEWLRSLIALSLDKQEVAIAAMERALQRSLTMTELTDPNLWVRVWNEVPDVIEVYPALYFPRLPRRLTGLSRDLVRLGNESALRDSIIDQIRLPLSATEDIATEIISGSEGTVDVVPSSRNPDANIVVVNQISPYFGPMLSSERGINVGDTYNVGQAGAVGSGASASNMTFNQLLTQGGGIDLKQLASELNQLQREMESRATEAEHNSAVDEVTQAAIAAERGDTSALRAHLERVGKWGLATANAIGTSLAAAAIKSALGI